MKKNLFLSLTFLCLLANAQNKKVEKFAATILPNELKEKLTILASDEMEGRETATEGQKKAAAYIEQQFISLGLKPGNGNSYQQKFSVYQDVLTNAKMLVYGTTVERGKHFSVSLNSAINGNWKMNDIAFVGFGNVDKNKNDFTQVDIKDKWVMLIDYNEDDIDKGDDFTPKGRSNLNTKVKAAMQAGALGLFAITKNMQQNAGSILPQKGSMYMKRPTSEKRIPVIYISYQIAASLLNKPLDEFKQLKNLPIADYKTDANLLIEKSTNELESTNVIAVLEGTDKKDEYVFLTAHYDHLGKRDIVIYYGADDDGSGTVSVIEMAEAFVAAKQKGFAPRRSIVFLAVSGEEKGLWGSDYYSENPIYPLAKTSVDLNIDMVGRIDPTYKGDSINYIYVIGEDKLSSDLLKISDSINTSFKMELDRRFNDPKDVNRFYYRSDHYNFAKKGVPVIFYFNGTHKDYHKPSDTVDKINFDLMAKRVKLIFTTAWVIANKEDMLKRDLPLNMPEKR